jgi:hypothetical protein
MSDKIDMPISHLEHLDLNLLVVLQRLFEAGREPENPENPTQGRERQPCRMTGLTRS